MHLHNAPSLYSSAAPAAVVEIAHPQVGNDDDNGADGDADGPSTSSEGDSVDPETLVARLWEAVSRIDGLVSNGPGGAGGRAVGGDESP